MGAGRIAQPSGRPLTHFDLSGREGSRQVGNPVSYDSSRTPRRPEASEVRCFGSDNRAKALEPRRYWSPAPSPAPPAQGSASRWNEAGERAHTPQRRADARLHVIDNQGAFDA